MPPEHETDMAPTLRISTVPAAARDAPVRVADDGMERLARRAFEERYRPGELLGKGGMGQVLLSQDQLIGRRVAMKVISGDTGDPEELRCRFIREAMVQGQLEHPAVLPVYDLGVDPKGTIYFTMKRVRGITLKTIIAQLQAGNEEARTRHSRRRLLTAFSAVCLAIDFAHRRGVLHRDLKPANVMLGDFGEVYVLDWGIAKVATDGGRLDLASGFEGSPEKWGEALEIEAGQQTDLGAGLGTLGYMPGEQLRGEWDRIGPTADVFALGAILFELLTLEPLIPRGEPSSMIYWTNGGVEARASACARDKDLPPELEAICLRATATDPAARCRSARELHAAIEAFLDGERNLELRREMASAHARKARALMGGSVYLSLEARREALREVGRCLALDPDNEEAAAGLYDLLSRPPQEEPAEVRAAIRDEEIGLRRADARLAGLTYLSLLFYLPLLQWMGVRSLSSLAAFYASTLLAAGIAFYVARRGTERGVFWMMLVSNLALGTTATLFGPLFVMPGIVAVHATGSALHFEPRNRWVALAGAWLALLVPLLLERIGVLPPSYSFTDGQVVLFPGMVELRPGPTLLFLTIVNLSMVLTGTVSAGRLKATLTEAQRRLHLQSWQLRQLVGHREARESVAP
jgi:eukaryotic-like serine/threonine-protein kinase